ncbi:MAG: radical SAM protein [Dehalococcoidales bacterium]|nr:radical SAM protein [Dehalococcoidales bacterium]
MMNQPDTTYKIDTGKFKKPFFEMGPIRPPSEGADYSLLLRVVRNCPWNRCLFCSTYKTEKFGYRSVEEVKEDIDVAKALYDEIKSASWKLGLGGSVNNDLMRAIVHGNPEIYGDGEGLPIQNLVNVANWIVSGGRTVFLQDADALIMRTPELVEVLEYLKRTFPTVERITSYARAKTCNRKTLEELKDLHKAGLSRLHVGLESGNNDVLSFMQKGVTREEHIAGGRKVVESGISLSEYYMPGLGGKKWSKAHALDSASALSEINADFIRVRSLIVRKGTLLYDTFTGGGFEPLGEDEMVDEIALFVENLNCHSYIISDQMSNLLFEVEGQLPDDKEKILERISRYQQKSAMKKLEFRLKRRLQSYLGVYGYLDEELDAKITEAMEDIQSEAPDAAEKVNQAIAALKQGFV